MPDPSRLSDNQLIADLRAAIGHDGVLIDGNDMARFTRDWHGRYGTAPACVILPRDTAQVSAAVRICADAKRAIVPQGGNTGLCGGAVADEETAVIICLSRMARIRAIDTLDNTMIVDAGCVLADIQAKAKDSGRLFPVSLGAEGSCQIGGIVSTNAGGTNVFRYGTTRDNILGLEVVLPDGTIWNGLSRLRKNNTGYDLRHLFIGAEGTLGIVAGASLKLHPLPTAFATSWVCVRDPRSALILLDRFQTECGQCLSAFELMNAAQLELVIDHLPGARRPAGDAESWHVLIEMSDTRDQNGLEERMQALLEMAFEDGLATDAILAQSETQRLELWSLRHGTGEANRRSGIALSCDIAVPVSEVPDFLADATRQIAKLGPTLQIVVVAHMVDGNVHFLVHDAGPKNPPALQDWIPPVRRVVYDAAARRGGTFSAEHGIGQKLLAEMERQKPAVDLHLMRAIKAAIDPHDGMNPARLLPPSR